MRCTGLCMAALVLIAATVGCESTSPTPPPSPSPVASTTPAETQLQRQTRLDFEGAEKAYRSFNAELTRVLSRGGAQSPTAAMTMTAAGPYLKTYAKVASDFAYAEGRQVGRMNASVTRGAYSPTSLNLDVCEDSRKVASYVGRKLIARGEILKGYVEVRKVGGLWKLWNADRRPVEACD